MEFRNKDTILETASQCLNSLNKLTNVLTPQPSHINSDLTNTTIANFKKLSSLLNCTGHARFRRAPLVPQPRQTTPPPLHIQPQPPPQYQRLTLDFTKNNILKSSHKSLSLDLEFPKERFSISSNSSFMSSTITGDGTISNGRQGSSLFLTPAISGGRPPLSASSLKNKCHGHSDNGKCAGSNKWRRMKGRKNRIQRTVRVPAISENMADIPKDGYQWRKYGQKSIIGSPYPRGYYKCTTAKECPCPARKKVERAKDDPKMMIVTYQEEHCHEIIHTKNSFRMDVVFEGQR